VLLGLLGALTGMLLAIGGAWALTRFVFENQFAMAWAPAAAIASLMVLLTAGIGLLTGREVFRGTPMAALREA
jgi:putative ABC transport system permease protein